MLMQLLARGYFMYYLGFQSFHYVKLGQLDFFFKENKYLNLAIKLQLNLFIFIRIQYLRIISQLRGIMNLNKKHLEQKFNTACKEASQALYFAVGNLAPKSPAQTLDLEHEKQAPKTSKVSNKTMFDYVQDFSIDQSLQNRISNLKLGSNFNPKLKESVFKKHKKEQEQLYNKNRKAKQSLYVRREATNKMNFEKHTIKYYIHQKQHSFSINCQDMNKLGPQADLNDTIVDFYLKFVQNVSLPLQIQSKTHFFSSFLMQKLIAQFGKDDYINDRDPNWLLANVKNKVTQNYTSVKRWAKKDDIFQKELVIFPINAFRHWFCIIMRRPYELLNQQYQNKCELIYCDSMFQKKSFIVAALRRYLQLQCQHRKGKTLQLNQNNLPCYQLLLPRQTNTHDCGIYMLVYIQQLCSNPKFLEQLNQIKNRIKLNLFPRFLISSMRQRLRTLFNKLINATSSLSSTEILKEFNNQKKEIMKGADPNDYDRLNQKEQQTYERMYIGSISGEYSYEEKAFMCLIRFYLDPEINYYEKDK